MSNSRFLVGFELALSQSSPHVEEASSPFGATYRCVIVLPELASHQKHPDEAL